MRARPRHALANDEALVDGAVRTIAARGWDATTMNGIAEAADLTYGAAYARYPDRVDLAVDLWTTRLAPALSATIEAVDACTTDPTADGAVALRACAYPSADVLGAMELVQASAFEPRFAGAVQDWVTQMSPITLALGDAQRAAVLASARIMAFGLILTAHRPWVAQLDLAAEFARFANALRQPVPPAFVPPAEAPHLRTSPFTSEDSRVDAVLAATADEVATRGYRGATLSRIIRASETSAAFIYQRWPAKSDLVAAAGAALIARGLTANAEALDRLTREHGRGIAEAALWRAFAAPDLGPQRRVLLELERAAVHDSHLANGQQALERALLDQQDSDPARAYVHAEIAIGLGVPFAAELWPQIVDLPFDAVTVPLTEGTEVLIP